MYTKRTLFPLFCLVSAVLAQGPDVSPEQVAQLRLASTHPDQIGLLKDGDFVFNFLGNIGLTTGGGGKTVSANRGTFPALVGNGIAMTLGFLGPCGLNTPHVHPRATEFNFAVNGTLRTGFLAENGARFVFNEVPPGSASIFPKGAIHFEQNTGCEPATFVAAFNDEDPGGLAVAQRFFGLPLDIIEASLDSLGVQQIAELESMIPNNVALGTKECLKKCGITNTTQPKSQRQPRGSANSLPPGFTAPTPAPPNPEPSVPVVTVTGPGSNVKVDAEIPQDVTSPPSSTHDNQTPILIALLVINGLFVAGSLAALFMYVLRKRGGVSGHRDPMVPQFAPLHEDRDTEYYDPYHRTPSPVTAEKS